MSAEEANMEEALDYGAGAEEPAQTAEDQGAEGPTEQEGDVGVEDQAVDQEAAGQPEATDMETVKDEPQTNGQAQQHPEGDEKEPAATGTSAVSDKVGDPLSLPPHGCVVFVGGIPRTATEAQLTEFCQEVGEVFKCTILKDVTNPEQNRGIGFVTFKTKEAAAAAMEKLTGKELPDFPGAKLRLHPSGSKNKLYLGNVPRTMPKEELEEKLKAVTTGLEKVELLMEKTMPGQNRGFCFLEYYNHECANLAKKVLSDPGFQLGDRTVTVAFADAKDDAKAMLSVKSVYVGNLPEEVSEDKLKDIFSQFGEVTKVVLPPDNKTGRKTGDFGFIHFTDHTSAVKAVETAEKGDKPQLDGKELNVKMARPPPQMQQQDHRQGPGGGRYSNYGGGYGGRGGYGGARGSQAGYVGRSGRGRGPGRGRAQYTEYDYGYDYGYEAEAGYGDDYGGYSYGYGYSADYAAPTTATAGMAMVPMVLPNGQVGYVLSSSPGAGSAYSSASAGPLRSGQTRQGGRAAGGGRGGYGMDYGSGGSAGRGRGGAYGRGAGGGGGGSRYRPY